MGAAATVSEYVATRRAPLDAATRRSRRLGIAAAVALHAGLIAVLLTVRPWEAAPREDVVYDLVFVPPAQAPAPPAAAPDEAIAPETPSGPPDLASEPESAPTVTTVPEPPKPVTRPRPHRQPTPAPVQAPTPSTAEAPTPSPAPATTAAVAPAAPVPPAAHPAPDPAYTNTLLTWLDRHKEYPWTARRRGMQGRVVLRLAVARSGKVTEARIESSSGAEILDEAAMDMVQRANPVPPLPASFAGDRAEFRVPVEFALSQR